MPRTNIKLSFTFDDGRKVASLIYFSEFHLQREILTEWLMQREKNYLKEEKQGGKEKQNDRERESE